MIENQQHSTTAIGEPADLDRRSRQRLSGGPAAWIARHQHGTRSAVIAALSLGGFRTRCPAQPCSWRDARRTSSTVPRPGSVSARVRRASAVVVTPSVRFQQRDGRRSRIQSSLLWLTSDGPSGRASSLRLGESDRAAPTRESGPSGRLLRRHLDREPRDVRMMKAVVRFGADRWRLDAIADPSGVRRKTGPCLYKTRPTTTGRALPGRRPSGSPEITQRAARDCRGLRHEGAGALAWNR